VGCRWCDCPKEYGPSTTIYNRFNRWSRRRFWIDLVEALAASGAVTKSTSIDSTYVKAHRCAHEAQLPHARRNIDDAAHALPVHLRQGEVDHPVGTECVVADGVGDRCRF
jgi:transposase